MVFALLVFFISLACDAGLIWFAVYLGSRGRISPKLLECLRLAVAIFLTASFITDAIWDPPYKLPALALGQSLAALLWFSISTGDTEKPFAFRISTSALLAIPYVFLKLLVWAIFEPDIIRFK